MYIQTYIDKVEPKEALCFPVSDWGCADDLCCRLGMRLTTSDVVIGMNFEYVLMISKVVDSQMGE